MLSQQALDARSSLVPPVDRQRPTSLLSTRRRLEGLRRRLASLPRDRGADAAVVQGAVSNGLAHLPLSIILPNGSVFTVHELVVTAGVQPAAPSSPAAVQHAGQTSQQQREQLRQAWAAEWLASPAVLDPLQQRKQQERQQQQHGSDQQEGDASMGVGSPNAPAAAPVQAPQIPLKLPSPPSLPAEPQQEARAISVPLLPPQWAPKQQQQQQQQQQGQLLHTIANADLKQLIQLAQEQSVRLDAAATAAALNRLLDLATYAGKKMRVPLTPQLRACGRALAGQAAKQLQMLPDCGLVAAAKVLQKLECRHVERTWVLLTEEVEYRMQAMALKDTLAIASAAAAARQPCRLLPQLALTVTARPSMLSTANPQQLRQLAVSAAQAGLQDERLAQVLCTHMLQDGIVQRTLPQDWSALLWALSRLSEHPPPQPLLALACASLPRMALCPGLLLVLAAAAKWSGSARHQVACCVAGELTRRSRIDAVPEAAAAAAHAVAATAAEWDVAQNGTPSSSRPKWRRDQFLRKQKRRLEEQLGPEHALQLLQGFAACKHTLAPAFVTWLFGLAAPVMERPLRWQLVQAHNLVRHFGVSAALLLRPAVGCWLAEPPQLSHATHVEHVALALGRLVPMVDAESIEDGASGSDGSDGSSSGSSSSSSSRDSSSGGGGLKGTLLAGHDRQAASDSADASVSNRNTLDSNSGLQAAAHQVLEQMCAQAVVSIEQWRLDGSKGSQAVVTSAAHLHAVAALLWACARTGHRSDTFVAAAEQLLAGAALGELLKGGPLAQLVWAAAVMQLHDDRLLQQLATTTADRAPQMRTTSLVNAVWAFTQLRRPDTQLLDALTRALQPQLQQLCSQELAQLAIALVRSGWVPLDFFDDMGHQAAHMAPHMGPAELSRVMWAFATARFADGDFMDAAAARAAELAGAQGFSESRQVEAVLFAMKVLQPVAVQNGPQHQWQQQERLLEAEQGRLLREEQGEEYSSKCMEAPEQQQQHIAPGQCAVEDAALATSSHPSSGQQAVQQGLHSSVHEASSMGLEAVPQAASSGEFSWATGKYQRALLRPPMRPRTRSP